MPLAIPNELKKIQAVIRRAEELDRDKVNPESRIVAYYCRQYAVHTGIPLAGSSEGAKTCLGHLLEQLEKEKEAMDQFTREEAAFLCRKFATDIFDKADFEDREGKANKNTAKTFYAAATFLQILEQFYSPDAAESADNRARDRKQILYSKWKATDILNAIKEGREPVPGAYDPEEEELQGSDEEAEKGEEKYAGDKTEEQSHDHDKLPPAAPFAPPAAPTSRITPPPMPPPPYAPPSEDEEMTPPPAYSAEEEGDSDEPMTFSAPPPEDALPPPKVLPPPRRTPAPPSSLFTVSDKSHGGVSKAQLADATELTRFAMAALEDKEVDLAAERLQQALQCLGR